MKTIAFKLVLRSWWKNKTFAVISIVSLAIGIACTNLLTAFVIHEYNVEAGNPNKERILCMSQDSPMKSGEKILYVAEDIPAMMKEKYTEVEDFLRFGYEPVKYITVDHQKQDPIRVVSTDASFTRFFPYKVLYGDLNEALTQPNKLALSEQTALKLFGKTNPIGKTITIIWIDYMSKTGEGEELICQVAAVLEDRGQSFLKFDALTAINETFMGGSCLILTNSPVDKEALAQRLKEDRIPTLQLDKGGYHFNSLQEQYFLQFSLRAMDYFNHRQLVLLYVGIVSAILILIIACINYINLNFSRVMQQVRMIQTQKMMGATIGEINKQLFIDTFFTVTVSFILSFLITHDLIPVFNSIVSGNLKNSFFFNWQVLPVIVCFILFLSFIPAVYMSRKISGLSSSGYRDFFTGNKKRNIVTSLSIAQYVISIILIISAITVNSQIRFTGEKGSPYKNLIEIGNWGDDNSYIPSFVQELKKQPELRDITISGNSILENWLEAVHIDHNEGGETYYSLLRYSGESNFLDALHLKVLSGFSPEQALTKYPRPVYINEKYAELFVPEGESPIGKPLKQYDKQFKEASSGNSSRSDSGNRMESTIAGIVENLYTRSLTNEACLSSIHISTNENNTFKYVYVRLDGNKTQQMTIIRELWEKMNPGKYFTYKDVYADFMLLNKGTTEMAELLLMYSIISIFLTCFGLFGLALYATEQRTKEIGIRKVNGATVLQIMLLLNRQFFIWIGTAFVIAVPVAWLLMNYWLESFVYRTETTCSAYLLSGAIALFVTLLTVSWHSYRAASGNPVDSLKAE